MRIEQLHYELPDELIAQQPVDPRDSSRLLVLNRNSGKVEHRAFHEIGEYFRPGDVLVVNDTRVIPARFFCQRATGGRVEALYLHFEGDRWCVLLKPAARMKEGQRLRCVEADVELELIERRERGQWLVQSVPQMDPFALLFQIGQTPLPPYIRRDESPDARDMERYQTVYAERAGAAAAPTAGLHFTSDLLERLEAAGVQTVNVTLHVGLGTFAPVSVDDLRDHVMHAEYCEINADTVRALHQARREGRRVIAVGTTSVRVLETLPGTLGDDDVPEAWSGWTDIFLYPPATTRNVDCLVTNFHQPGSTLLALIMSFAGVDTVRAAYKEAVEQRYRFFSYGDAMLIL